MYICLCNAITEKAVRDCAQSGACSLEQLSSELGIGTACGRCCECAKEVLRDVHGADPVLSAVAA